MIMRKRISNLLFSGIILFAIAACGNNGRKSAANQIRVGVAAGPELSLAEAAKKVAKEKYGLEVELVSFTDYILPNVALSQGDIDVNAYQHKPFMDEQVRQRGYKLAVAGQTFVYPIAAYSNRIKNIAELQPGSTIAIPNDPTNGGRALLLLQKHRLLELRPGIGLLPKVTDISANPNAYKIVELEAPQLPRSLDDQQVALAIINNNFAAQAGLIAGRDGLLVEDKDSPYVNLIVSREDNKEEEKVKQFVKAYQSVEVLAAAQAAFKGGAIKGW
jgi:D-methionine transport system substrate-binding protein